MDIAFIDIDGIIADNKVRADAAQAIASTATAQLSNYMDSKQIDQAQKSVFYHATTFYNPESLYLDALIPGSVESLIALQERGFIVILCSSRPESLRSATTGWLNDHGVPYDHLVLKSSSAQFTKTVAWKATTLDTLAMFLNASHAIFVDDEAANIDEVTKHLDGRYHLNVYSDLPSAVRGEPTK